MGQQHGEFPASRSSTVSGVSFTWEMRSLWDQALPTNANRFKMFMANVFHQDSAIQDPLAVLEAFRSTFLDSSIKACHEFDQVVWSPGVYSFCRAVSISCDEGGFLA
jgi:hypothetical protein